MAEKKLEKIASIEEEIKQLKTVKSNADNSTRQSG